MCLDNAGTGRFVLFRDPDSRFERLNGPAPHGIKNINFSTLRLQDSMVLI